MVETMSDTRTDTMSERLSALEAELNEPLTLDGLTRLPGRTWSIFQRRRGHRHSTDDLLTGWYAAEIARSLAVDRALDLGAGIGSVGLLVLARLSPEARLTSVEAQAISFRFLRENVVANGLDARVCTLHGDLRELALDERFPLVTGSPPYFDRSAGIVPADSQKAHARFELRGDIGDYALAAARHLAPGGRFVFCFPWPQRDRALERVRAGGLVVLTQRDVVPREGIAPLFALFSARREDDPGPTELTLEPPFIVRDTEGKHTPEMHALRASFGWPPSP